jgi:Flp pilus assembly protein TadG
MKADRKGHLRRFAGDQRGQVLPWVAFMMLMLLGMAAFVVDIGHAYVCRRQLQAATDAAALAGAKQVYLSQSLVTAAAYAATTGSANAYPGLNNVQILSSKTVCLNTVVNWGILCEGPNTANAVQVIEQATIPTFFAQVFGIKQLTLAATSTAAKGKPVPLDVAVVIDTTLSMNNWDSNCTPANTELGCAMNGAQTMLSGLAPTIDYVSVFTFPNLSQGTVQNNRSCSPPQSSNPSFYSTPTSGLATSVPYSFPTAPGSVSTGYQPTTGAGTYQVVGFSNDYRTSNSSQIANSSSSLVQTVGAPASKDGSQAAIGNCLAPPNEAGEFGTYLAGAIYAAQYSLAAQKALREAASPSSPAPINVMIILSDGNPNASMQYGYSNQFFASGYNESGTYPSDVGDCGQAVVAGNYAKTNGTLVFAIAYGASTNANFIQGDVNDSNCPTDQTTFFTTYNLGSNKSSYPNISPCQTMKDIATPDTTDIQFFYSDYNQSGSNSTCQSTRANAAVALNDIFASIVGNLSKARLIPDGTT